MSPSPKSQIKSVMVAPGTDDALVNLKLFPARHCLLLSTEKDILGDAFTITSIDVESIHPNCVVTMRVTV